METSLDEACMELHERAIELEAARDKIAALETEVAECQQQLELQRSTDGLLGDMRAKLLAEQGKAPPEPWRNLAHASEYGPCIRVWPMHPSVAVQPIHPSVARAADPTICCSVAGRIFICDSVMCWHTGGGR